MLFAIEENHKILSLLPTLKVIESHPTCVGNNSLQKWRGEVRKRILESTLKIKTTLEELSLGLKRLYINDIFVMKTFNFAE